MTDPNVLKALEGLQDAMEYIHLYLKWDDHEDLRDALTAITKSADAISALRDEVKEV